MQVQTIMGNDAARHRVKNAFRPVERPPWNEIRDSMPNINRRIFATAERYRHPLWSSFCSKLLVVDRYCYTRQPGDKIRQTFKETKQLLEPITAIVDTENNIVEFVINPKFALRGSVRNKSDDHDAITPSTGVAVATLPMARRSNATGASTPAA